MLRLMRDKATSWLIKVLLGAIVVVFVFWGVGSFRAERGGRVAVVNGEIITIDDYKEAYNNLLERLRQSFGNQLNEDMLKTLGIKEQALKQLIDNRLMIQEAHKLKFRVSDEELAEAIMNIGAFQSAGTFDNRLYQNVLSRLRLTPEQFEVVQRDSMLVAKVRALITGSVKVSDQEAREWYNWQNASANIDFALFEPDSYEDIQPTAEETKKFFEAHQTSYKTEPMVKVRYLLFSPDAYRSKVTVAENDIQNYYATYQAEFKKPKTVEARHVLIKVDPSADMETVAKQRQKALEILKMALEGQDFAELAQKYSQGPTRSRGGYLGEFRRETMVKPFADRAFSMEAVEISQPVRTRFGWHIIKVEKVNPAAALSFEEARNIILQKLTDETAKNLAYDAAETVSEISFEGDDLVQAAMERNLKLMTTNFFTKSRPAKEIGSPARFTSVAFALPVMEISDIQDFKEGYYIMQVIEIIPAKISEFETVNARVRDDLIKEIQDQKAHQDAGAFLTALKNGKSMDSESKKYKITPQISGFFKRDVSSSEIGLEQETIKTAFKLSEANKLPPEALKGEKGYYIIQFKERKAPDPLGFNTEAAKIMQSLLAQKTNKTFNAYLEQIKSKSEITIKEGFLE